MSSKYHALHISQSHFLYQTRKKNQLRSLWFIKLNIETRERQRLSAEVLIFLTWFLTWFLKPVLAAKFQFEMDKKSSLKIKCRSTKGIEFYDDAKKGK